MTNAASYQRLSRDHDSSAWAAIGFEAKDPARSAPNRCAADDECEFSREAQEWAGPAPRLARPSVLAKKIGLARACGALDALTRMGTPALLIDIFGRCRRANAAAESLFDGDFGVSQGRLRASDRNSDEKLQAFVAANGSDRAGDGGTEMRAPVVVARRDRLPLILEVLPLDTSVADALGGAAMLVTITDVSRSRPAPSEQLLTASFALTPAEARFTVLFSEGKTPDEAAETLGVARDTARKRLKAIYAKTGTSRQAELTALLGRLAGR